MVVGVALDEFDMREPDVGKPFRSLVGHLMWLANNTRPDILSTVRAVARYSHAPKRVHWDAALLVSVFQRGRSVALKLYVDSDFASRATGRRSVSGVLVMCAGGCCVFV